MSITVGSNSTNFNLFKHPGLYVAARVDGKGWHRAKLLKFSEVRVLNWIFFKQSMHVVKVNASQEECWVLLIDLGWDTWLPPSLLRWRKMKQQKIDQTTIKSTNRSQLNILLPVDHYLQVAASSHSLRKFFILTLLSLLQVERNFFLCKEYM